MIKANQLPPQFIPAIVYVLFLVAVIVGCILGVLLSNYSCSSVIVLKPRDSDCTLVNNPFQTLCDLAVAAEYGCTLNFKLSDYNPNGMIIQPTIDDFCNQLDQPRTRIDTIIINGTVNINVMYQLSNGAQLNITRQDSFPSCTTAVAVYNGPSCESDYDCMSSELVWTSDENQVLELVDCDDVSAYWNSAIDLLAPPLHQTCYRFLHDAQLQQCQICGQFTNAFKILLIISSTLVFAIIAIAPLIIWRLKSDHDRLYSFSLIENPPFTRI